MKTAKSTKKKASARKAPKTTLNVNVEYVEAIADESIATIMALRALVRQLATELEEVRK
jgi:hypothetical protein